MNLTPAFGSEKAWVWFTLADMANEVSIFVESSVFIRFLWIWFIVVLFTGLYLEASVKTNRSKQFLHGW